MKKLIFAFALLMGTMFASCNGVGSSATTDTVDSVEVVIDSVPSDSIVVDSVVADTPTVGTIA